MPPTAVELVLFLVLVPVLAMASIIGLPGGSRSAAEQDAQVAPLELTFDEVGGNDWWVEVSVASDEPVQAVDVRLDEGSWTSLPHTAWGTWAKSIHVTTGTEVEFRATANTGQQALSQTYTWE